MATQKEKDALEKAQAKAKDKVGGTTAKTIDTIKFKSGSGSGIVFKTLEKAKEPLTMKEIEDRAVKAGLKNPARAKAVTNWFVNNNIAIKDAKGCVALVEKGAVVEAPAEAS